MNEARPYASLSSGLLARKGTAKPAMRPQGYNGNLEDLGWNDMGQAPADQPRPPAPAEHVPSSIAALTPAPKIQRTHPTDSHLPPDMEGYDYELGEDEEVEESVEQTVEPAPAEFALSPQPEPEPVTEYRPEPMFDVSAEPEAPTEDFVDLAPEPAQPVEEFAGFDAEPFDVPSVAAQQRAILERLDGIEELEAAPVQSRDDRAEIVSLPSRVAAGDRRKAAFTLRLDAERHLRLRLACAVTRHSAQQIVMRALDEALANIPEIEALASQVPAKPGRAGNR